MIELLNSIDTKIFLFLNDLNTPVLDPIMLAISYNKIIFLFILIGLLLYTFKLYGKFVFLAFLFCTIGFGLSDSISTKGLKNTTKRLRPCHNEMLKDKVHLAGKKCWGGKYGFVSSHASNSFAIAFFFFLIFKRNRKFLWLFLYAGVVAYSRVYLARHYPGDIFFGALLGLICGYIGYRGFTSSLDRLGQQSLNQR